MTNKTLSEQIEALAELIVSSRRIVVFTGAGISTESDVPDLREGFSDSQRLARELELYRQKYCGCLYSEWERYGKVKIGDGLH